MLTFTAQAGDYDVYCDGVLEGHGCVGGHAAIDGLRRRR